MFDFYSSKFNKRGMAALLTVVIVGMAGLIMALSASLLSLGDLEMGYESQKTGEVASLADGCLEEALQRLRLDDTYTGETLSLGENSCIISVSGSDTTRQIIVRASLDVYEQDLEVGVTLGARQVSIDSWQQK